MMMTFLSFTQSTLAGGDYLSLRFGVISRMLSPSITTLVRSNRITLLVLIVTLCASELTRADHGDERLS